MSVSRLSVAAMAALTLTLAAVAPPAVARQASTATPRAGYVAMTFCNRTSGNIYLAVSYKEAPGSNRWVVEGWKKITGNNCITLSMPNDGKIYDYAEDESDGDWGGDFTLCVERPGPFYRINDASFTCNSDLLEGFGEIDPTGLTTKTVNYNP